MSLQKYQWGATGMSMRHNDFGAMHYYRGADVDHVLAQLTIAIREWAGWMDDSNGHATLPLWAKPYAEADADEFWQRVEVTFEDQDPHDYDAAVRAREEDAGKRDFADALGKAIKDHPRPK
jgi:uncharacterized protein (DUF2267 family)